MTTDSNEVEKEIMKLKKEIMIINQSRQRNINELYDEERDDEDWDTLIEILIHLFKGIFGIRTSSKICSNVFTVTISSLPDSARNKPGELFGNAISLISTLSSSPIRHVFLRANTLLPLWKICFLLPTL